MARFATLYARARSAVFVWSMGLTQHRFGVENVAAIVNLALARGMLGRPKTGLMPIRGHSGVQGAAECGNAPNALPGGGAITDADARRRIAAVWGFSVPEVPGMMTSAILDAAHGSALDVLSTAGYRDWRKAQQSVPSPAPACRLRAAAAATKLAQPRALADHRPSATLPA